MDMAVGLTRGRREGRVSCWVSVTPTVEGLISPVSKPHFVIKGSLAAFFLAILGNSLQSSI